MIKSKGLISVSLFPQILVFYSLHFQILQFAKRKFYPEENSILHLVSRFHVFGLYDTISNAPKIKMKMLVFDLGNLS